jgi:hypothetical protein
MMGRVRLASYLLKAETEARRFFFGIDCSPEFWKIIPGMTAPVAMARIQN